VQAKTLSPNFTITCFGLSPREELLLRSCVKYLRESERDCVWEFTPHIDAHLVFVHPRALDTVAQLQEQGRLSNSVIVTTQEASKLLSRPYLHYPESFTVPVISKVLELARRTIAA
jgi:hypothetical protein